MVAPATALNIGFAHLVVSEPNVVQGPILEIRVDGQQLSSIAP